MVARIRSIGVVLGVTTLTLLGAGAPSVSASEEAGRGNVVVALDLKVVTDLLQDENSVYAQMPAASSVSLDDPDQPGYVIDLPIYKAPADKAKTLGGFLFINVRTQAVVNLSFLTVNTQTQTVSAIASFSSTGYQGRIDIFTFAKGHRHADGFTAATLRLAKGAAQRLNQALSTQVFKERAVIGTLDMNVGKKG